MRMRGMLFLAELINRSLGSLKSKKSLGGFTNLIAAPVSYPGKVYSISKKGFVKCS